MIYLSSKKYLDVYDLAKLYDTTRVTILKRIKNKELKARKIKCHNAKGFQFVVSQEDANNYVFMDRRYKQCN